PTAIARASPASPPSCTFQSRCTAARTWRVLDAAGGSPRLLVRRRGTPGEGALQVVPEKCRVRRRDAPSLRRAARAGVAARARGLARLARADARARAEARPILAQPPSRRRASVRAGRAREG